MRGARDRGAAAPAVPFADGTGGDAIELARLLQEIAGELREIRTALADRPGRDG